MPAAVEVSGFEAAFASRAVPAWHMLGTVFDADADVDTAEMLRLAHMNDWNVRLADVSVAGVDAERFALNYNAVIRDNPFDAKTDLLAIVGERYTTYQNEDTAAFAQDVIGSLGKWETMGSIADGRKVFGSLLVPKTITLDPKGRADKIADYLLFASSHDGSIPLTVMNTPVRVVCQNTLNMAMSKKAVKQSFRIRHTTRMEGKVQLAREITGRHVAYMDEFSRVANQMIETEITKAEFDKIVALVYPAPDKDAAKSAVTRYGNKVETLEAIYSGTADGPNTMKKIGGTAWGAYNALTEAVDWYRKPRKGEAESVAVAASGLDPVTTSEKNRILSAVLEVVA